MPYDYKSTLQKDTYDYKTRLKEPDSFKVNTPVSNSGYDVASPQTDYKTTTDMSIPKAPEKKPGWLEVAGKSIMAGIDSANASNLNLFKIGNEVYRDYIYKGSPIEHIDKGIQAIGKGVRSITRKQDLIKIPEESRFEPKDTVGDFIKDKMEYFEGKSADATERVQQGTTGQKFLGQGLTGAAQMLPTILLTAVSGMGAGPGLAGVQADAVRTIKSLSSPKILDKISTESLDMFGENLKEMIPFMAQAGGGYAREAEFKDASIAQQIFLGTFKGYAEGVSEMIPFEHLKNVLKIPGRAVEPIVKKGANAVTQYLGRYGKDILMNMLSNIGEEVAMDPFATLTDKVVIDKSIPWFGEGGIFDINEAKQSATGAISMSLIFAAVGLTANSRSHIKAMQYLKENQKLGEKQVKELSVLLEKDLADEKVLAETERELSQEPITEPITEPSIETYIDKPTEEKVKYRPQEEILDDAMLKQTNLIEDLEYQKNYLGKDTTAQIEQETIKLGSLALEREELVRRKETAKAESERQYQYEQGNVPIDLAMQQAEVNPIVQRKLVDTVTTPDTAKPTVTPRQDIAPVIETQEVVADSGKGTDTTETSPKTYKLYHGSKNVFDVFQPNKAQAGEGVFLTNSIDAAKEFGNNVYEVEIQPSKIATDTEWIDSFNELQDNHIEKLSNLETQLIEGKINSDQYEKMYEETSKEWAIDETTDINQNALVSQNLKQKGYDVLISDLQSGNKGSEFLVLNGSIIKKKNIVNKAQGVKSTNEDVGYHAGDLGKSEHLGRQYGSNRGTGHYGTGTYFVKNQDAVKIGNYKDRPIHKVDLSEYNLFKPVTDKEAGELHDALKYINTYFQEAHQEIISDGFIHNLKYEEPNSIIKGLKEVGVFDEQEFQDFFNMKSEDYIENQIDKKEITKYLREQVENLETRNENIKMALNYKEDFDSVSEKFFGLDKDKADKVISKIYKNVLKKLGGKQPYFVEGMDKSDSISTQFMKELGYEGVDVRHLPKYDNTKYGTVVYDLKESDTSLPIKETKPGTNKTNKAIEEKNSADVNVEVEITLPYEDIDNRTYEEVSKRKAKSIQNDYPELKPYIQAEAKLMLKDLNESMKGKRIATTDEYGEMKWLGVKRQTTPALAEILDMPPVPTYERVKEALQRIVDDEGRENIALAKRIELIIDDNLTNGSKDMLDNERPPNQEYVAAKGITDTSVIDTSLDSDFDLPVEQGTFAKPYAREITILESNIKELETKIPELKVNLQKFARERLKMYQELLAELKSKNVSKWATFEVNRLINLKEDSQDLEQRLKDELKVKLKKQKKKLKADFSTNMKKAKEKLRADFKKEVEVIKYLDNEKKLDAIEKISDRYEERIDKLKKTADSEKYKSLWKDLLSKQQIKDQLAEFRVEKKETIAKMKQEFNEKVAREKERKTISAEKTDLLNSLKELKKVKLRPHYQEMADELLLNIDTKAKSMTGVNKLKLEKSLDFFKKQQELDPSYEIPERMVDNLKRLDKTSIKDMTIEQVRALQETVDHIIHLNKTTNKLIGIQKMRELSVVTADIYNGINAAHVEDVKDMGAVAGFLDSITRSGAMNSENQVLRMVGWKENNLMNKYFYDNPTEGQRKKLKFKQVAETYFNEKTKGIDISDWRGKKAPREVLKLTNGDIAVTKAEKISLYLHTQNEDNMRHLTNGGGRLKSRYTIKKFADADKAIIRKSMTKNEMTVADAIEYFFEHHSKDAINETSLILDGYWKAKVKKYFPIIIDRINSKTPYTDITFGIAARNATIEGGGFLKDRTKGTNTILIEDAFEVFTRSVEMVSSYYGYAVPLRDAKMIFYSPEIQNAISKKFTRNDINFFNRLFEKLEGNRAKMDPTEKVITKLTRNFQRAVLGVNPWVRFKQLASYPTAFAELDVRDIRLTDFVKKTDWKHIEEWSPVIWFRRQGYVTRETGEIAKTKDTLSSKGDWATASILKYDSMVIAKIWQVVETETKRLHPELKGDAFNEAVARRTEQVIYRTQPNYTDMQRSNIGMSDNALTKILTLFSTQRNQNYNLMYKAIATSKQNPKRALRYMSSVISGSLIVALINSARDVWKDKDVNFMDDFIESIISNMYFAGDVYSLFKDNYDIDIAPIAEINKLARSVSSVFNPNSTSNLAGNVKKIVTSTAQIFGMPLKNVISELEPLLKNIDEDLYKEWKRIWEKPKQKY